ncbi:O-methylsterigmatocystin oxidoreductase [Grifola frondosa]|uniref:O-methylsterigmatocystin oxidoreductase n=1 Tax=Grifola frondosa TaxID=5627 RepID=A0A1C7LVE7_GRIFR|nr:O-methylsterigmatocystin oxidoreductase [Grifola frondosa]
MPVDYQHRKFAEWGNQYGDISFARLFRTPALILNSVQAAQDLMDKRSAQYSDRPRFVLVVELMGWDSISSHMAYGDRSRKHRKWIHDAFQTKAVLESYYPLQRREASVLVSGLLESPEAYITHFRRQPNFLWFAAALVVEITYGHRVTSLDDKYIGLAERATTATAEAGSPGSMLVDFFPILKELPAWLPGCDFKRRALDARPHIRAFLDMPFQMVKDAMWQATGTTIPSVTASLIEKCSGNEGINKEDEEDIKGTAGFYTEPELRQSVVIALTTFVMAMVLYPNVFKKAQEEIDGVIGNERLPDFTDRDSLPYLGCTLKELYRWNSPLPLGLPHRATSDDIYRGYRIPQGCMIIPNIWGMMHAPDIYPEPEKFRPERFLETTHGPSSRTDASDPYNIVFGFGRRLCPGQAFADSSLWLAMAHMIATLDIRKRVDSFGKEINFEAAFSSGFVRQAHYLNRFMRASVEVLCSAPKPFTCVILPRSKKACELVQSTSADLAH